MNTKILFLEILTGTGYFFFTATFRKLQDRQRESSIKTLRSLLSRLKVLRVEWRNSAPRFALPSERKNEIEPTTVASTFILLCHCTTLASSRPCFILHANKVVTYNSLNYNNSILHLVIYSQKPSDQR